VRVRQQIEIQSTLRWALFDTDARHTYVISSVARMLTTSAMPQTIRVTIGNAVHKTNTAAILDAYINGRPISALAFVIDEIGRDENGIPIEILFGALNMQQWGIRPIPNEERLDLSHYPEIFVEF
jgi:hypothetical protein